MMPNITLIFIAIFTIFQVIITNLVGYARIKNQVHFYDEGDIDLRRRQRAHANFTETVPITLLAMGGAEILGTDQMLVLLGGLILLTGRIWHYYVIRTVGWSNGRAASMMLTFIVMIGFSLSILWKSFI
ncbi:MAPEG family protein [Shewanella sp. D64]|uniref:MAPEG family protein n=1 Tax=unclassified Shewanella TaxID=196818 RepID=UPI0022BA66B2|nr:MULTISPECIES: MAPEG family protein [unclassified Shewanella]MEC4727107.1 MAPEG family protein [Shewanella sp. D64]MEC4737846.1 MAPEG family protein [Shewanella sp. E94]WBJ93898.1 MAPEG family protein [Shewanella sp. MTB7]